MARRPALRGKEKVLRALRPNAGLEAIYRRRLLDLIDDMAQSVEYWITAAYRKAMPAMAQDAAPPEFSAVYVGGARPYAALIDGEPLRSVKGNALRFSTAENAINAARIAVGEILPVNVLQATMKDMADQWLAKFDVASQRLANFFGKSVAKRTDAQLQSILRQGGFSVEFKVSPYVMNITEAAVQENVALIKSIPQQYLKEVEGLVMRAVQRGRAQKELAAELRKRYGITRRRAALIAKDQNNKATSAIQEARREEAGIKEAIWMHSHAGKKPRPTHVAMNGKRYQTGKGLYDSAEGRYVLPGELINCRCVSRSIVPGSDL